jgi:hypothetical protein
MGPEPRKVSNPIKSAREIGVLLERYSVNRKNANAMLMLMETIRIAVAELRYSGSGRPSL